MGMKHCGVGILVLVMAVLVGCAHRAGGPRGEAGTAVVASAMAASPSILGAMTIEETPEGTVVEFPVQPGSELFVDYDMAQRLVVRIAPATPSFVPAQEGKGVVHRITVEEQGGKASAIMVELATPVRYLLSRDQGRARLLVLPAQTAPIAPLPPSSLAKAAPKPTTALVDAIEFTAGDREFTVLLSSAEPVRVIPGAKGEAFTLVLPGAQFRPALATTYRIQNSPVQRVQAQNVGPDAQLVFFGVGRPAVTTAREGGVTRLRLALDSLTIRTAEAAAERPSPVKKEENQELGTLFPGMKKEYRGVPITLDLQEAKVEHVLRLISEVGGYNLILDEGVSGSISLKLVDIPWDQALDLILLQKKLGMVERGNLLRIAPLDRLRQENEDLQRAREAEAKAKESLENVLPTRTEYIQINYSTAAEFEPKVKEMLSPRGKVASDARTNTLIVTDIEPALQRVQGYIAKLDRPERQVLIEARLVYATDDFQRDIGIRWGVATRYGTNPTEQYQWDNTISGFNAPLAAPGLALDGTIGKIFGKDLWTLDASLRLGETKNLVKTVSSPRIVTLNNNRAEIKQGIKLATSGESQSGGTTTEYTEAVLKISVQPQITPDNKLILDVEVSDDSPTATGRDIETKSARTKMIVGDRETIVIGGVLKSSDRSATQKIPGLGDIPLLGRLFRQDETASSKQELLIFLHPRIL